MTCFKILAKDKKTKARVGKLETKSGTAMRIGSSPLLVLCELFSESGCLGNAILSRAYLPQDEVSIGSRIQKVVNPV